MAILNTSPQSTNVENTPLYPQKRGKQEALHVTPEVDIYMGAIMAPFICLDMSTAETTC